MYLLLLLGSLSRTISSVFKSPKGATTFRITTPNIMTLSKLTVIIITLSKMTLSLTTLSMARLGILSET